MNTYRILLVCTGNTCRSALAHGMLLDLIDQQNRRGVQVASAGVATYGGTPASEGACDAAQEVGIDLSQHRSSAITPELVEWADLILTMEQFHNDALLDHLPQVSSKIHLLGEFGPPDETLEIPDPVGAPVEVFRSVRKRIDECLQGVLDYMSDNPKPVTTITIGADHRGFALKQELTRLLAELGYQVEDIGCTSDDRCDFPLFAAQVAERVATGQSQLGILACSNGVGMSIAANKVPGIRAGLAWCPQVAEYARRHNNVQVLCLPGDFLSPDQARDIVQAWLNAKFEGGRYAQRIAMIEELEKKLV